MATALAIVHLAVVFVLVLGGGADPPVWRLIVGAVLLAAFVVLGNVGVYP